MKPYRLRLLGLASGGYHYACNQFVKAFDPAYVSVAGYDGGLLEVTPNPDEALAFESAGEAFEVWRKQAPDPHHIRPDGKPNCPLTAFTCEVIRA